ncbi:hypothetical protein C206_16485 [Pseudomonas putida TRO1]|uniref:Uncharacterized protein n=1 Tax=Pseudomonas putida TRO1 TaxID=1227924 RepID=A0AAD2ZT06_PSEPU|nr:hypothetical protein [Pseudomonas putida]ELS0924218.1 hypothetical protein [Pseudomonas putida]ENY76604.1 hypothetical protein C206_16485 [Pseudomonas putida TRO1]
MLNLAVAEQDCVDLVDFQWSALSENERRLIGRFRQMREQERHQVRRLIEQLANDLDDTEY